MCTKDDERSLNMKLQELHNITPALIGLSPYFTLDESSKIIEKFNEQFGHAD